MKGEDREAKIWPGVIDLLEDSLKSDDQDVSLTSVIWGLGKPTASVG